MTETAAEHAPKGGKVRLLSLADLDRRTRVAQQARELVEAICGDLGGEDRLSTLERLQAENAAMTATVLRDMQCRWLKGEEVSTSELATVENTFNRTAAALGTQRRPRDVIEELSTFIESKRNEATDG